MLLLEADFWAVIVPIVAAILLVAYVVGLRLSEGVSLVGLFTDRKFLIAFFYSGALVTIWLSCYYFYNSFGKQPPAAGL